MKVLHIIAGTSPNAGGPTQAIFGMAKHLHTFGVQSTIVNSDSAIWGNIKVPLNEEVNVDGTPIWYFHSPRLRKYGYAPKMRKWLNHHCKKFDLLHIHGIYSYTSWIAANVAYKNGVPFIVRPAGQIGPWCMSTRPLLKKTALALVLKERILCRAACIHTTSEMESNDLKKLYNGATWFQIPLAIDIHNDSNVEHHVARERLEASSPFLAGKKIILFLSRIDPKKGLELLIPCIKRLAEQRNDFVVVIAGSGPASYEEKIRNMAHQSGLEKHVWFPGFVQGEEKSLLLSGADIFVLPSKDENFGLVVLEAMASGLPVVISRETGISCYLSHDANAMLIGQSERELQDTLVCLLDDASKRNILGENARRLASSRFGWEAVAQDIYHMYRQCIRQNKKSGTA